MSPHPQSKKAKADKARRQKERASLDADEQQARLEAHLARQQEDRRRQTRHARRRRVRNAVVGVAVAGALAAGLWFAVRPAPELSEVTRPPSRGRGHVAGATFESPTPTSGEHDAQAPRCSSYSAPLEPALAVHALEHGVVILWYDADQPDLSERLASMTEEWDSHVIIAANDSLDAPIVATAWNRLKKYEPDDSEIVEFVRTYRKRGPESVACDI